jgi:hypothetical protein
LPPAIVVTGDRPRHKEENKLQVKEVKTLLPPCLKHPEKGPVERSRFTNRCPLCDGIRLARTRTRQRYGGPGLTDEQKSDILQRYPAETLEQLRIKHKVPVEHVRGVLRAAGKLNTRERCTPLTEEEKSTLPDLYPSQMTLQQLWESFAGHSRECVRSALREKGLAAPGRPSRAITHEIRNRRLRSM